MESNLKQIYYTKDSSIISLIIHALFQMFLFPNSSSSLNNFYAIMFKHTLN